MKRHTQAIRESAIRACEEGKDSQGKIAFIHGVSDRTLRYWLAVYRKTGRTAPIPGGHPPAVFHEKNIPILEKALNDHPDATLNQLIEITNIKCSVPTLSKTLKRLDWRFKKNASTPGTTTRGRSEEA